MEENFFNTVILLLFTTYWFNQLNRIWFHIDEEYEKSLERINLIPKWLYPFRNVAEDFLSDKGFWIILSKVGSIIMTIIIVLVNIMLLPQFIFGK